MWSHPAFGTSLLGPRTKRRFFVLYATRFAEGLACYTQEEIGEAVGLSDDAKETRVSGKTEDLPKDRKLLTTYTDAEWKPPLYDIWSWLTDSARPPQESWRLPHAPLDSVPTARAGLRPARW